MFEVFKLQMMHLNDVNDVTASNLETKWIGYFCLGFVINTI